MWPYSYTAVFLQRDVSPNHDHQSHQNQDHGQTPWRDFPESENPMTSDDGCLCKTAPLSIMAPDSDHNDEEV